jgi:drug/metabolite transporter (DMT)-like permease
VRLTVRPTTAVFVVLCLTWGTTWLAIRTGVEQVPPLWLAGTRFTVAGVLLLGVARLTGRFRRPTPAQFRALLRMSALCIALCFGLVFWGETHVESGIAGVVVQGFVPIGLVGFAALLGRDTVTGRAWVAVATGVAGVVVIASRSLGDPSGRMFLLGLAAIVVGTLLYDLGSVQGDEVLGQLPAVAASGWENLLGGLMLLPVSLALEHDGIADPDTWDSATPWLAWLYLVVIGSAVGFTAYTYLLQRWGPVRTSAYAFVTPIIALAAGAVLADERFSASVLVGAGLIVAAVLLLWTGGRREVAEAPPAAVTPSPAPPGGSAAPPADPAPARRRSG